MPPSEAAPEPITVTTSPFTGLLLDRIHLQRRQVRIGNAILQRLKHEAIGLRDTLISGRRYLTLYVNGLCTAQRARLNLGSWDLRS
jgi:hypothetical protein